MGAVESLRELAVGDFARTDEDHRPHQLGHRAVQLQRRAGVAGTGTRGLGRPDHVRMSKRRCHSIVFEAA